MQEGLCSLEKVKILAAFLVRAGSVKLSVSSAQVRLLLRVPRPGDWVGLSSAFEEPLTEFRGDCFTLPTNLLSLSAFTAAMAQSSDFNQSVMAALNHDLSETIALIRMVLLSKSAEKRKKLARLLLKWCDDYGVQTPDGIRIEHNFTQYQIAEMISVSRETVTRLLSDFNRRGIIRLEPDSLFISSGNLLSALVSRKESV